MSFSSESENEKYSPGHKGSRRFVDQFSLVFITFVVFFHRRTPSSFSSPSDSGRGTAKENLKKNDNNKSAAKREKRGGVFFFFSLFFFRCCYFSSSSSFFFLGSSAGACYGRRPERGVHAPPPPQPRTPQTLHLRTCHRVRTRRRSTSSCFFISSILFLGIFHVCTSVCVCVCASNRLFSWSSLRSKRPTAGRPRSTTRPTDVDKRLGSLVFFFILVAAVAVVVVVVSLSLSLSLSNFDTRS